MDPGEFAERIKKMDFEVGKEKQKVRFSASKDLNQFESKKYKLLCGLGCGRPIVASDNPIPEMLRLSMKDTPCSECVPTKKFAETYEPSFTDRRVRQEWKITDVEIDEISQDGKPE